MYSGHVTGGNVAADDERVRRLLRRFLSGAERPRSYAGRSRGSLCQLCGNIIKPNDIEFDVAAGVRELRLDLVCHRAFVEEIARASQEQHRKSV